MLRRIYAIVIKEFRHILRDWQTLMIVLLMPVVMMFLYGYALTMDLKDVPAIIIDPSSSTEVKTIAEDIDGTTLFSVLGVMRSTDEPEVLFKKYQAKVIFRFPASFAHDLRRGGNGANVQVLIDGSDPNTGTILRNSVEQLVVKSTLDIIGIQQPKAISVQPRILYNPEQRSALYFVPGLMAIILIMISALLTSLTITRERELGTMEQLLVSPLKPSEIIVGKIIPYLVLAAIDGVLIMMVGQLAFDVQIAGSVLLLIATSLIYIFTSLAIGLLISTVASNQQMAMMLVLPATMLPTMILSGFIFPIASLPIFLRMLTAIVPATYFLEIIRGIVLKGVGAAILFKPIMILSFIGLLLILIAIKRFRVKL